MMQGHRSVGGSRTSGPKVSLGGLIGQSASSVALGGADPRIRRGQQALAAHVAGPGLVTNESGKLTIDAAELTRLGFVREEGS